MSVPRGCWVLLLSFCSVFFPPFLPAAYAQGARVNPPSSDPDAGRDDPATRDAWFMRGRIPPPGHTAAELRLRATQQKLQMRAARQIPAYRKAQAATAAALATQWTPLGPAPLASDASGSGQQDYNWVSGRATSALIDPADSTGNTVFVGGAFGGLWRSQNAGSLTAGAPGSVVWTPLIDNRESLAVGAIALQPGNIDAVNKLSKVILVGTGEANSSGDSYYGVGILRSTDAGATWTLITSDSSNIHHFRGVAFSKIAFSTGNPNLVVAAAATSPVGVLDGARGTPDPRGIYASTDAGASWTYATLKDGSTNFTQVFSILSVAYHPAANKFFAAVRYHGFYSSTDGLTWIRLTSQPGTGLSSASCPTTVGASVTCPFYRGEIAVVPGRNEMYVWYVDPSDHDRGIWRSTDGGTTWFSVTDSGITTCGDGFGCGTSQGGYNLDIAAIPGPGNSGTDIYAGAINLYKCSLPTNPGTALCNSTVTNSTNKFINLTHVYGCSDIAKVHPDQHGLNAVVASGKAVMYFANDGGIYRALDGYTGLTTGACGQTNSFDSLNQTLGSMTQFVSFSVHPTDPATLLGGTQDNGSPATAQAGTSTSWLNVNGGDGGFNEINPNNPTDWFTENTDVSIQRCPFGINCHSASFPVIIDNTTVGGDAGPFYTPYLLDPQDSNALIVGTCRIWRGASSGAGFNVLSPNFDTQTSSICSTAINEVSTIAAGGPKDTNGLSNVIYAGTVGDGPATTGAPTGGHVFVTTNAAGGTSTWNDRTPFTNGIHYTIGDVRIDPSDGTGLTAFAGIMGFGFSHVLKTTDGGVSWTDFSGSSPFSLPDAPVNSIIIDQALAAIYVGTDVGVFASSTVNPSWTEVGPAAQPGNSGFLPNVPVTRLRIFDSGGIKKLRASTYGRGIWEFPLALNPDFALTGGGNFSGVVNQPAQISGTLTGLDTYSKTVTLSCTAGATAPPSCSFSPASALVTAPAVVPFTLTATGNTVKTYDFNITAKDASALTHTAHVVLAVNTDFSISNSSGTQTVLSGQSAIFNLNVAPLGAAALSADVTLSCSGLPALTSCSFSPAQVSAGSGATPVTLTISTTGPNAAPATPIAHLGNSLFLTSGISLLGLVLLGGSAGRKRRSWQYAGTLLAIAPILIFFACGGGGSSPPPPPPVSISISPASGVSLFTGQTQKFTATVSNSTNTAVQWQVNGVVGGDSTNGTIDTTGLYTAPAAVPSGGRATVKAVAQADTTKSASSSVSINATTASGPYTITIIATSSGVQHTTTASLVVQ